MKVMIMAGTRPEAIKVAPVVSLLRRQAGVETVLCNSGQHREMIKQAFEDFRIKPDIEMDVMRDNQSLAGLTARLLSGIDELFQKEKPDWVLAQGDTMTVMAASLCAFYRDIRIGHIEAGLRTYNRRSPFPEEINRQIVGRVADIHFAPTQRAVDNLLRDGANEKTVFLTGNTVVDALLHIRAEMGDPADLLLPEVKELLAASKRMILVTGHRRENFGEAFVSICQSLARLAEMFEDVFILYPVHLNPNVRKPVLSTLGGHERVLLPDPLTYKRFVAHLAASHLVLTDSGGIQEEAPSFGKPVLVMRNDTERPEGIEAGVAMLVGTHQETIVGEAKRLLTDPAAYQKVSGADNPYGDGHAAERIVSILLGR